MKLAFVTFCVVGLVTATTFVSRVQQPLPQTPIQVEQLRGNLYLLRGGDHSCALAAQTSPSPQPPTPSRW